jgi:DNA-binding LacI/PurR family transcriptional regulator
MTASRVANGSHNVDANTRRRVLDVMDRLGYRPNLAGRALATGRYGSIGVLTTGSQSLGNTATVSAIARAAADRDYSTVLLPSRLEIDTVARAYDRLRAQGVDGAIIVADRREGDASAMTLPPGIPIVFVDAGGSAVYASVDSDQMGGARIATEHLLDLGHSTVHHIAGPEHSFAAHRRSTAWARTLRSRGAEVPTVAVGDWSAASGRALADGLLHDGATAVFAANDQMAFGLLHRLHELGVDVPDTVSVVGFDDVDAAAAFWPALTTVRQSFTRVGHAAVDMLLRQVAGEAVEAGTSVVPVELVVRASTVRASERAAAD